MSFGPSSGCWGRSGGGAVSRFIVRVWGGCGEVVVGDLMSAAKLELGKDVAVGCGWGTGLRCNRGRTKHPYLTVMQLMGWEKYRGGLDESRRAVRKLFSVLSKVEDSASISFFETAATYVAP